MIRRRCKCGCGGVTNFGAKYIWGHNCKIKYSIRKMRKIRRRCACGCGKITNPGRKYIKGHNSNQKGVKRPEATKRKMSVAKSGKNHPFFGKNHSEKSKLKNSLFTIEMWKDPEYQRKQYEAQNTRPNKTEVSLLSLLNKLFPNEYKYTGDFSFMINGKNPDFVNINGQKKLIELYGDYWHKGQDPQDRINAFSPFGYKTLVIWESELKKSRLQLRKKLIDFHTE